MVKIAQLCKEHNAWLVVDEAYEHFLHDGERCTRVVDRRCAWGLLSAEFAEPYRVPADAGAPVFQAVPLCCFFCRLIQQHNPTFGTPLPPALSPFLPAYLVAFFMAHWISQTLTILIDVLYMEWCSLVNIRY